MHQDQSIVVIENYTSEVADSSQSVILNQVENGVAIRMKTWYLWHQKIQFYVNFVN
jgi:aspartate carbamoyltransferase catalytic subunit